MDFNLVYLVVDPFVKGVSGMHGERNKISDSKNGESNGSCCVFNKLVVTSIGLLIPSGMTVAFKSYLCNC